MSDVYDDLPLYDVACETPGCPTGSTVRITLPPILNPGEDIYCWGCLRPLALTPEQRATATRPADPAPR